MRDEPIVAWKNKIRWYLENNHLKDLNRVDSKPTEFEWKIFPRITTLGLLEEIQKLMKDLQCEPEHFNDRIIFMSMYNDIVWGEKRKTQKGVNVIHRQLRIMLADSLAVVGHSWDPGQKRNGREPTLINQTDPGIEWPTTNVLQGQRHAWLSDYKFRKSLSDIGWTEQDTMLFDRIALDNHAHL